MLPANLPPLKIIGTFLMTTFGTTQGRDGVHRILENSAKLPESLFQTFHASGEMCDVGELLHLFSYFWTTRLTSKWKLSKEGDQTLLYQDQSRMGRTPFSHDLTHRPFKAVGNAASALAGVHLVLRIGTRFFSSKELGGNGHRLRAFEHAMKAFDHFQYIRGVKKDCSKCPLKGAFNLVTEVCLGVCHLSENKTLGLIAGLFQVINCGFLDIRRESKNTLKAEWIKKMPEPVEPTPEDSSSIVSKFFKRLFGTTYLFASLADIEQYARMLLCVNGFAESFSYLSGQKKHPIFSYLLLASSGMYALMAPKYFQYWAESKKKEFLIVGGLQVAGIIDTTLFFHQHKFFDISKQMGKILIFKSFSVAVSSTLALYSMYKRWKSSLSSEVKEKEILNGVNAAAKVPLVSQSALNFYGYPIPQSLFIVFSSMMGLDNTARGLFWESLKEAEKAREEKKLANLVNNGVEASISTADKKALAEHVFL